MAKYGPDDLSISVDDSGGSAQVMDAYIDEQSDAVIEAILEESHTFGDSWVEHLFSGLKRMSEITFSGFYDDTGSTGPDAIFVGIGAVTRTVTITWGGSKTTSFEAIIKTYTRTANRNGSTRFSATLVPTGTVTEA